MLKAMNLPPVEWTPQAKLYALHGGAEAVVLWAPTWKKLMPRPGAVDATQWQSLDDLVAFFHGKLPTIIAVPSDPPDWIPRGVWDGQVIQAWRYYLTLILTRHKNTPTVVLNEPDYARIPSKTAANMMKTAAIVAYDIGAHHILGPAAATGMYSVSVANHLRGWHPPRGVRMTWAHHHYQDVKAGRMMAVREILAALRLTRWPDGPMVWLTEGGYIYDVFQDPNPDWHADPATWHYKEPLETQEQLQLRNVLKHYHWCAQNGHVGLWANYEYVDSMWSGWSSGLMRHDGVTKHPLHDRWFRL